MVLSRTCALACMRILVAFLVVHTTLAPAASYAQSNDVSVSRLLKEIKIALNLVSSTNLTSLPPLSRVTLNLKAVLEKESGNTFNLVIVRFGKTVAEEVIQTVSLELAPPPARERSRSADDQVQFNISTALASAVVRAALAVEGAQLTPELELRRLTATVRFGVSTNEDGKLNIQIFPLTFDLGGSVANEAIQEILVEFSKPPAVGES